MTQGQNWATTCEARKADLAASTQAAIVDVLVKNPSPL